MVTLPLACLLLVGVQSVTEVRDPRPGGWVVDQAGVVSDAEEKTIGETLGAIHDARGAEVVVVTVDDVPGTPKAFATELFNHWKLGSAAKNDGVLVLLVVGQRRLEIETGTGMEAALPAWWLSEMQGKEMVPAFKRGALGAGLVAGANGLRARLDALPGETEQAAAPGEYRSDGEIATAPPAGATATTPPSVPSAPPRPASTPPSVPSAPPRPASTPPSAGGGGGGGSEGDSTVLNVIGGLGLLGVTGGGVALGMRAYRRRRRCEKCKVDMLELDEVADDAYLSDGQKTEEKIGSMNYTVLICPGCQDSRIKARSIWFSGKDKCDACSFKTETRKSRTLVTATYDHGGKVEVTEDCAHCKRHHVHTYTTARRTRPSPSSSSSSSRSSFGSSSRSSSSSSSSRSSYSSSRSSSSSSRSSGGSSRGGGAGSGW